MRPNKDGLTPLIIAARDGNYEVAKMLIDKGADVNSQTGTGATALMYASFLAGIRR